MDVATIVGLAIAIVGILYSVVLEGGSLRSMMQLSAALIVFGGTYGAAIASTNFGVFLRSPANFIKAVLGRTPNRRALVEQMVELATLARKEGLLALEAELEGIENPVLGKALQLVIDGMDPEIVAEIMDTELMARAAHAKQDAQFFINWGGLGPTLGVTGTVMGLVHMMEKLEDPSQMGPAIAAAFCATLYGVATANIIFIPVGKKLQALLEEEKAVGEMIIEGVGAIQEGASPIAVRQRLGAYLGEKQGTRAARESREELKLAA